MLVHRRVTPSIKLSGTHLHTWVERGTVRVKCLAQEHNAMSLGSTQDHKTTAPPKRWCHIGVKLIKYGVDQDALKWFKSYQTNRMQRCNVNNHLSRESPLNCGVPQGSRVGPVLFSIYINDLPNCLNVGTPRMYADDTNVTFSAATIPDLESQINSDLKYTDRWLKANKLSFNVAKTEFMVISSRQKLQSLNDYTMDIHIDVFPINQSNQSKSLGLIMDGNLSWKAHIHEISKKVSSCIGALKRVRPFVSMHTAIKIYKGLIEPHFDYCSAVWDGLTQKLSEKLQKLQNHAIRVITKSSYHTSSRLLLNSLGWDNISSRRVKQKANLMYNCINNLAPAYLVICLSQEYRTTIFETRKKSYYSQNQELIT